MGDKAPFVLAPGEVAVEVEPLDPHGRRAPTILRHCHGRKGRGPLGHAVAVVVERVGIGRHEFLRLVGVGRIDRLLSAATTDRIRTATRARRAFNRLIIEADGPAGVAGLGEDDGARENREVRFLVEADFPVVGVMGCQLALESLRQSFGAEPESNESPESVRAEVFFSSSRQTRATPRAPRSRT